MKLMIVVLMMAINPPATAKEMDSRVLNIKANSFWLLKYQGIIGGR